jgi:hypothetical protein
VQTTGEYKIARARTALSDIVLARLLPQAVLQNVNSVLMTDPYPHLLLEHLLALESGARLELFIGVSLVGTKARLLVFWKERVLA